MAATRAQLRDSLMANYFALRPQSGGGDFKNMQGDVIVMLGNCMSLMAAGCYNRSWPQLFALLEQVHDGDLTEDVRRMHLVVAEFLKNIDIRAKDDDVVDTTIFEALDRAGWEDIPVAARTAWLAMLGLYHLSRVWVVGRQRLEHGYLPAVAFETVAQAAGQMMRIRDQKLDTFTDGAAAIRAATHYGLLCGLTVEDMVNAVRQAAVSTDTKQPLDTMSLLSADEADADK